MHSQPGHRVVHNIEQGCMLMQKGRAEGGGVLIVAAALALLLVFLIGAFYQLSLVVGGANEVRHLVDAAALNVGRQAFIDCKVAVADNEINRQFEDVLDSEGQIGLANINLVWGKALLAAINARAMREAGDASDDAERHADQLMKAAEAISNKLSEKLSNARNHYPSFNAIAGENSVRMLGSNASVAAKQGDGWKTSLLDRGEESNLTFESEQLPAAFPERLLSPVIRQGRKFIPGYKPIKLVGDRSLLFVPFPLAERTHLVAGNEFKSNIPVARPLAGFEKPVPNALSVEGVVKGADEAAQTASAFVQLNPQRIFELKNISGFIRLRLLANERDVILNELSPLEDDERYYQYRLDPLVKRIAIEGGNGEPGEVDIIFNTGQEYAMSLYQALFFSQADEDEHLNVKNILLQRAREIIPDYTLQNLNDLLRSQPVIPGLATQAYVIYSPDGQSLEIAPEERAVLDADWLSREVRLDGVANKIAAEKLIRIGNNDCARVLPFGKVAIQDTRTTQTGQYYWAPGTGFRGCLGELYVERKSKLTITVAKL